MEFKDILKETRKEKGKTQQELADLLYVSKMAISHWEKGNSEPSIFQLKTLSKYFDVTIDYLVGNAEY